MKKISFDIKTFWKTIKPFLLDKVRSANKMTLLDKDEIIMDDYNTTKVLNIFFSKVVSNLDIEQYSNCKPLANNISDPVLKCVVKYSDHPNILTIEEVCNKHPRLPFFFSKINREEILREILKMETSKSCQDTNFPTTTIKENADIFAGILLASFDDSDKKFNFYLPKKGIYNACI